VEVITTTSFIYQMMGSIYFYKDDTRD